MSSPNYQFISHYANDTALRDSLNQLTESQWGITVLQAGDTDYVPFSMLHNGNVVANVCVGRFDLVIDGNPVAANMIQTVLTDPEHRNQGLIRQLFEHVQAHIKADSGRTFFPASRELKNFYAQFGYQSVEFSENFVLPRPDLAVAKSGLQKVDLGDSFQYQALQQMLAKRAPVSQRFGYETRNWLFNWYCRYFHAEAVYYVEELQTYLLMEQKDDSLVLYDIVAQTIPALSQLAPYLALDKLTEIRTVFCPDQLCAQFVAIKNEDDYFFSDDRLPLPSQEFCIPETLRG